MSRNLYAKVTLLGLELEDMLFLAAASAGAMLVGQFLFSDRYMFFLPMNWFLLLMVLVIGVPALMLFKYGKPRGYLLDLVIYYGMPRFDGQTFPIALALSHFFCQNPLSARLYLANSTNGNTLDRGSRPRKS